MRTRLSQKSARGVAFVVTLSALISYPLAGGDPYYMSLLNFGLISVLLGASMIVLLGYAGQISLGQGAFYGLGAYTAGILTTRFDLPFFVGLLVGPALAALLGYLVSRRISHLEPFYLAMATLVLSIVAVTVFSESEGLTGGPNGMVGIPAASLFGYEFFDDTRFFYLSLMACLVVLVAIAHLRSSRVGRALAAIKEDEAAAASMGIDVAEMRARAFALSGAICGLAGVLYAHNVRFISPETFGIHLSISVLVMAIIGGVSRWPGAILGAVFLSFTTEALRGYENWSEVIYGAVLFLVLLAFPKGILGLWDRFSGALRRRGNGVHQAFTEGSLGPPLAGAKASAPGSAVSDV